MNLPFVLDVAIGLIFIYLILSLLASEIQELIATVLQWRAEHLKKSIEVLLAGDSKDEEFRAIQLANALYNNPLIKNINQEAKGAIANLFRQFTWWMGGMYRSMKSPRPGTLKNDTIFGHKQVSGPSYIPAETFASTLIETLKIPMLIQKLSESRLEELKEEQLLKEIRSMLDNLEKNVFESHEQPFVKGINKEFTKLGRDLDRIVKDFKNNKTTLTIAVDRMAAALDKYIANCQSYVAKSEQLSGVGGDFIEQLEYLKQDIFGSTSDSMSAERIILLGGLKPTLTEITETFNEAVLNYRIIKRAKDEVEKAKAENSPSYQTIKKFYEDTEQNFDRAMDMLPESLVEGLTVLAKRAQTKVKSTEQDINQLREEIEHWFDRSMDRASGVYKRNAKGVAILIGVILALASNADSFHIIGRLARNPNLRTVITERASQVTQNAGDLETVQREVNNALDDIPIPIGWSEINLIQQQEEGRGWQIKGWSFSWLRRTLGWFLTGLAVAMGAPFWFDLLGKVINVRNAGKRPASTANKNIRSEG